jgi:hypothetical protein
MMLRAEDEYLDGTMFFLRSTYWTAGGVILLCPTLNSALADKQLEMKLIL